jgi:SanA protein
VDGSGFFLTDMKFQRQFSLVPIMLAIILAIIPGIDFLVSPLSVGSMFYLPYEVPLRKVAVVLGTSNLLGNGQPSRWFSARMEAAAELYERGRIQFILVSGDNSHESYNEPLRMREALLRLGVPQERVIMDYAGFSTFDSIIRARSVFGLKEFIVVSQDFQNERALFIARFMGVNVVAYNAKSVGGVSGLNMVFRESLARFKAFLDLFFLDTQPHFLGEQIRIE